ncbi:hypothetical protein CsSME_00007626 [Camellia sinensis var. sinensis]
MLFPNCCYVSKNDSLMEVYKLGFQLNKGFTLPKDMASLKSLDDISLIRTGVVSAVRASGALKVTADMKKRLKLMSDHNLKLTNEKDIAENVV